MDTSGDSEGTNARIGGNGALVSAAVVATLTLPITLVTLLQAPIPQLEPVTIRWILGLSAALQATGFLCRWAPVTAFAAGSALMLALALIPIPGVSSAAMMPSSLAYLLLVWRMASDSKRWRSSGALAVGIVGAALITTVDATRDDGREPLTILVEAGALAAGIVAAWALGALSRQRRLAEAQRIEERTRRALAEERARIGHDLHDVVSHSLAVMIAQAEAARVLARDPGADGALERVAETGRSAMRGLRGMLRVLDSSDAEPLEPAPGIDGLPDLVERARSPKHTIRIDVRGTPHRLSPDAGLAAYRTAQEALTNAIRHVAPPLEIDVVVEWREAEIELTVADDGGRGPVVGSGAAQGGTGLIGMAERVESAGGSLSVLRGAGWRVRAVLPTEEAV